MGVPSFYRWLVNKYPKIVSDAAASADPPEIDNLYLDMNGLIHPCFHPDDDPFPPTTVDDVFRRIHDYVDSLFDIVKPRKLLFMAIDGVAPRAKMNQQRSRRFRSAKDSQRAEEVEDKLRKQFEAEGRVVLPKQESEILDSNVITPGTEFMHLLSENLRSYVKRRLREDPAWGNIKVILSDDKALGEGEHKIMSFIRAQRASSEYDPNTRHCLYGLDADLIMLALATHEAHFSILREEVLPLNGELRNGNFGRALVDSVKEQPLSRESASSQESRWQASKRKPYQFLNVSVLREYLSLDMEIPGFDKFEFDQERAIDDFIFICFFAGNDFLPHIPSLSLHEGCIDLMIDVYKKEFQNFGGYLVNMEKIADTNGGYIKLSRVERFILAVGAYEEEIFSKRADIREKKLRRMLAEHRDAQEEEQNCLDEGTSSEILAMHDISRIDKLKISAPAEDADTVMENTKQLKQKVKDVIKRESDMFKDGLCADKLKLGNPGWRQRYYKEKFYTDTQIEMESTRKSVVAEYGKGLCWVLLYYFSEVPSFTWFFPYHYGPFASDFRGLSRVKVKFQKGFPFKPFDQLMGVLPPSSSHALPEAYKGLMVDGESKIIDLYPIEFKMDVDGKRFLWQGICILPFIDEERLLVETKKVENELKDEEKIRNEETHHRLFLRHSSELRLELSSCRVRMSSEKIKGPVAIHSHIKGIEGTLHVTSDQIERDDDEKSDICIFYEIPRCFKFVPRLLEGVNLPEKTVCREDLAEIVLWHEHRGHGVWRNQTPHYQKSDVASQSEGRGFCIGRGRTFVPQENSCHDHGNIGRQQPAGSFRRDDHDRSTSSYRQSDSNFRQCRGDPANTDWRVRNPSGNIGAGNLGGQRQYANQPFVANAGRGQGGQRQSSHMTRPFVPSGGLGHGGQVQRTSQPFLRNGGRGQERCRGWWPRNIDQ
ncbi:5'-3' exoribonuclease 3-like [Salvia splendens]|uniref:5'-3' exoribonuclease 3-like n=1 Tax=Salvia splendens TaxID=180675 RepID=UPI001101E6C0|nr:5'-3' exoribonuclease 3-like [Salvia splendens]